MLLVAGAGLALSGWAIGGAVHQRPAPGWPEAGAPLISTAPRFDSGVGKRRILIDPGHGAPGNAGNRSALCRDEQDFTLSLALDVADALARTGHFDVRLTRQSGQLVPYAERVRLAEAWGADVLVSLHSDVRGHTETWSPTPGRSCLRSHDSPGYSVLWSDEGPDPLVGARHALARRVSGELAARGFLPFDGSEYREDYAPDELAAVFADRHPEQERIFVLWRPSIPSILIETHNALDEREAARWEEPTTRHAFAMAVAAALVDR
jgi:N-acetylmuramoyl-L-alanine amidase